jgi:hypothetical protein
MRKHLVWVLGVAVALVVGITGVASATNTQTMDVIVTPSKVPKNKYKAGKLESKTVTGCQSPCGGAGAIKPVTKAQIFYDKDIKFDSTGIKQCKPAQIENTTTQQAKAKCAASLVGTGQAKVKVGGDPNSGDVNAVITAFNGQPVGGKPLILLHTRVDAIGQTTVLKGVLFSVGGKYHYRLDVTVPPLPLNTATTLFDVTVQHTVAVGGVKHVYISAKCSASNKTWDYKGTFTYSGAPPITATDTDKCQVA